MMKDQIVIGGVSADMDEIEDIQFILNISYISHRMRTLTQKYEHPQLVEKADPKCEEKATDEYDAAEKSRPIFSVRGLT